MVTRTRLYSDATLASAPRSYVDVVVVGGGAAGTAAAIAAARNGASVCLVERYGYFGGMASGGMVLVLDDMVNGDEVTVRGICAEFIERMAKLNLAVFPDESERGFDERSVRKWRRWGLTDFQYTGEPKPVVYAVAFDPDGWKRVSMELLLEAGVSLRTHSTFVDVTMSGDAVTGVMLHTKEGPQSVTSKCVIDASGDADVVVAAGAPVTEAGYLVSTVFRLGGVDTERAESFERADPGSARMVEKTARRILGGSWQDWWLKTPLPGVVWCNCPNMSGYNGFSPSDLGQAEIVGRGRIYDLVDYLRTSYPGFETCQVIDVAPQIGVRQSRMAVGDYVVTLEDVRQRRAFTDSVARGRDYYTPYRSLLPLGIDRLLVAGRHYSADPRAQRISREIPPCMAMGEAAGVAAALAAAENVGPRSVRVDALQKLLREQGADPGDIPSANADGKEGVK